MKCANCGKSNTKVTNSRNTKRNRQIWRRRACLDCGLTFTTYEAIDPHYIKVRAQSRVAPFDRAKLFSSVYRVLDSDSLTTDCFHLTETIENKIMDEGADTIESTRIFEIVRDTLRQYDRSAYLRYLSFYPDLIKDSEV